MTLRNRLRMLQHFLEQIFEVQADERHDDTQCLIIQTEYDIHAVLISFFDTKGMGWPAEGRVRKRLCEGEFHILCLPFEADWSNRARLSSDILPDLLL